MKRNDRLKVLIGYRRVFLSQFDDFFNEMRINRRFFIKKMTRPNEEKLLLLNKRDGTDVLSDFRSFDEENTTKMKLRLLIVLIISLIFLFIGIFGKNRFRLNELLSTNFDFSGGLWSNSLAIVTDAANTFVDAAGFLLGLISIHLASKKPSTRFSFGYVRAGASSSHVFFSFFLPSVRRKVRLVFSFRSSRCFGEYLNVMVNHRNSSSFGFRTNSLSRF